MVLAHFSRNVVFGLSVVQAINAIGWVPSVVDETTGSGLDEEGFYNEEPKVFKKNENAELVEEQSASFKSGTRILRRQNAASTGDQGGSLGENAGITQRPGQTQNYTEGPFVANVTNTSSGDVPFVVGPGTNPNDELVNCLDVSTGRSNRCWAQLNLTGYVKDWLNNHHCYEGEGFSTCYLRQNNFVERDCSAVSLSSCTSTSYDQAGSDPRKFYVAYNIYGKHEIRALWQVLKIDSYQSILHRLVGCCW